MLGDYYGAHALTRDLDKILSGKIAWHLLTAPTSVKASCKPVRRPEAAQRRHSTSRSCAASIRIQPYEIENLEAAPKTVSHRRRVDRRGLAITLHEKPAKVAEAGFES